MTKKLETNLPKIYDLDLYYQIWAADIAKFNDIGGYSINVLFDAYTLKLSPTEFYYKHVYLPM